MQSIIYCHTTCYCSFSLASVQQDVYEDLWSMNMDIANKTLQLDFMQQMQSNSLQAERYVNFTLQDINYVREVTGMLKIMSKKVKKPKDLSDLITGRYNSYKSFLDLLIQQYFFKVRAETMQKKLQCTVYVIYLCYKYNSIDIMSLNTECSFYQTNTSHEEISGNLQTGDDQRPYLLCCSSRALCKALGVAGQQRGVTTYQCLPHMARRQ